MLKIWINKKLWLNLVTAFVLNMSHIGRTLAENQVISNHFKTTYVFRNPLLQAYFFQIIYNTYSHSIVAGGLLVMSYTMRLT